MQVVHQDEAVFQFRRQRHGQQRAIVGAEGVRHVVVDPVAKIRDAVRRQQFRRVRRFQLARAEPAAHRLAGQRAQALQGALYQLGLVLPRQRARMRVVHVPAVADDFIAARQQVLEQIRIALGQARVDGQRRLHAVRVKRLQEAVDADAVAVVAQGKVAQIRVRHAHAARQAHRAGRIHGEKLQSHVHPQGQLFPVRPGHGGAPAQHRPVVALMVHAMAAPRVGKVFSSECHARLLPAWRRYRPARHRDNRRCSIRRSRGPWPATRPGGR